MRKSLIIGAVLISFCSISYANSTKDIKTPSYISKVELGTTQLQYIRHNDKMGVLINVKVGVEPITFTSETHRAIVKLQKTTDKDSAEAGRLIDVIYSTLYYGSPEDRVLSENYVVLAANNSDPRACFAMYHSRRIIAKMHGDKVKREYWLKKAHESGEPRANRAYALSILDSSPKEAIQILRMRANVRDVGVILLLDDIINRREIPTVKNNGELPGLSQEDVAMYLMIASKSSPEAMKRLSVRYREGNGVIVNNAKADDLDARVSKMFEY